MILYIGKHIYCIYIAIYNGYMCSFRRLTKPRQLICVVIFCTCVTTIKLTINIYNIIFYIIISTCIVYLPDESGEIRNIIIILRLLRLISYYCTPMMIICRSHAGRYKTCSVTDSVF